MSQDVLLCEDGARPGHMKRLMALPGDFVRNADSGRLSNTFQSAEHILDLLRTSALSFCLDLLVPAPGSREKIESVHECF
jgi:hypothetical protein